MWRFKSLRWSAVLAQIAVCSISQAEDLSYQEMTERFLSFQESQHSSNSQVPFEVKSTANRQRYSTEILTVYQAVEFNDLLKILERKQYWCELVFLHPNLKTCTYDKDTNQLTIYVGRKKYQRPSRAFRVSFDFNAETGDNLMSVILSADSGPFGSKNYLTVFQAIPVSEGIFGRWSFDLDMGYAGIAIDLYYKTLGRNKIGFTLISNSNSEDLRYVRGLRGAIERNFMRYYLAMKIYLNTWDMPTEERFEARINGWYDASESYSKQLSDLTRTQYLRNKRKEIVNQKAEQEALNLKAM